MVLQNTKNNLKNLKRFVVPVETLMQTMLNQEHKDKIINTKVHKVLRENHSII